MTTAAHTAVDWIRLTVGDRHIELAPEEDIDLRIALLPVEYDGHLDLLTMGPPPELHVSVDLIPLKAEAIGRCEERASVVAAQLGVYEPPLNPLREFALEAGLSGEGVPYNRVTVPKLHLLPGPPPWFDDDQPVPGVQVCTARAVETPAGAYVLTRAG